MQVKSKKELLSTCYLKHFFNFFSAPYIDMNAMTSCAKYYVICGIRLRFYQYSDVDDKSASEVDYICCLFFDQK